MAKNEQFHNTDDQKEKDDSLFDRVNLDDGRVLELYCNPRNEQVRRFYIKNPEGELVAFGDQERFEQISDEIIHFVKDQLAENARIVVTDEEAKRVALAMQAREFFREFDENKDVNN